MTQRRSQARWVASRQRWQISIQRDGERKTFTDKTPGIKGKFAAERKADKWLKQGTLDSTIRLEKMWQMFLDYLKPDENGRSANGSGYSNYVNLESIGRVHILPSLKTKKLCNISTADWQRCIDKAYKQGLSKKTLKNIRGAITTFYDYAERNNIDMPPLRKLRIQDDAPTKEKNILQPDDLEVLFNNDTITVRGKEEKCFFIHAFRFFVLTGLRRGELCALPKSNIENDIVYIRQSINKHNIITKGKNKNANRWFILPYLAQVELEKQQELLKQHGIISPYVFPDKDGNMLLPQHLYKQWNKYRNEHDISCTLHELRHTMISLNKNTVPPELLKQVVGHSAAMDTFGIYGHEVDGEKVQAVNLIDKTLQTYIK